MTLTTKGSLGFVSIVMTRAGLCGVTISVAVFVWIVRGSVRSLSNPINPSGFPCVAQLERVLAYEAGWWRFKSSHRDCLFGDLTR